MLISNTMLMFGGCAFSMMFIVALYLPWCEYLAAQEGLNHSCTLIILCVSQGGDLDLLLRVARFTAAYVRLVGQEPAPIKCVFLSTSRVVGREMRDWVLSQKG